MRTMTATYAKARHVDSAPALVSLWLGVRKAVIGFCPVKEAFTGQGLLVVGSSRLGAFARDKTDYEHEHRSFHSLSTSTTMNRFAG